MDISPTVDLSTATTATQPCQLTATEAAALLGAKKLSCEELLRSCLARANRAPKTSIQAQFSLSYGIAAALQARMRRSIPSLS